MNRRSSSIHAVSPSGLTLLDGECSDSYLSMTGAFVSPAAKVMPALRMVRAVAWVTVKVLFVVIAVPLIVLFAVASFGAMFAGGW